jgi:hypothetical protein
MGSLRSLRKKEVSGQDFDETLHWKVTDELREKGLSWYIPNQHTKVRFLDEATVLMRD